MKKKIMNNNIFHQKNKKDKMDHISIYLMVLNQFLPICSLRIVKTSLESMRMKISLT